MSVDKRASGSRPCTVRVALAVVVVGGYAWTAGHFTTFTRAAEVTTLVPGAIGLAYAVVDRPPALIRPDRSHRGWLAWGAIAAVIIALEAAALAGGADPAHPTISDLLNPFLLSTSSRALGFAGWLAAGIWLSRR